MTVADIPLPSGLRLIVDVLLGTVASALRGFRRGGAFANRPPWTSLAILRRLTRIVRYAFLIIATQIEIAPCKARGRSARRTRGTTAFRQPAFRLFPRYRVTTLDDENSSAPSPFANTPRDPFLSAERQCAALRRALETPLPLIRRMARRLPTQLMVFGWRPPKRPPPYDQREFWEEMLTGHREARFQVRDFRRRRLDIATQGASAS